MEVCSLLLTEFIRINLRIPPYTIFFYRNKHKQV